jgi:hypothetical protein
MKKNLCMLLILFLSGCGITPVQPWQRGTLARPQMQPVHAIDSAFDDHIYFSKEASSGGQSFSAGGCGCN